MVRRVRFVFALFVYLVFISTANTEQIQFVTEELAPYQMLGKNGKQSGIAIDIVNEIIKETQLDAKITFYPWARAYRIAKNQKNTFIFSMLKSTKRSQEFHWVGKIMTIQAYLAAKSNSNISKFTSIAQAYQYKTSVVRGSLAHDYMISKDFIENQNLYITATFNNMWNTLFSNNVDLVITNNALYQAQIIQAGFEPQDIRFVLALDDFSSEMYLAANLNTSEKLLRKIRDAFTKIKADGRYQKIIDKWTHQFNSELTKQNVSVPN